MLSEEWITIAEAARRLSVNERTLRRFLARPENRDKTRQEEYRTRTGTRQGVRILSAFLPEIKQHFEIWENSDRTRHVEHGNNTANTAESSFQTRTEHGAVIVAYERLIEEQKARITDLQTALEHEREQSKRLTDALAREQALRLVGTTEEKPVETTPEPRRHWWEVWKK